MVTIASRENVFFEPRAPQMSHLGKGNKVNFTFTKTKYFQNIWIRIKIAQKRCLTCRHYIAYDKLIFT